MSTERRRTPSFTRFLVTGAVLGFLVGALVGSLGEPVRNYANMTAFGFFGVMGAGLGLLAAGLLAVLLDRRR